VGCLDRAGLTFFELLYEGVFVLERLVFDHCLYLFFDFDNFIFLLAGLDNVWPEWVPGGSDVHQSHVRLILDIVVHLVLLLGVVLFVEV